MERARVGSADEDNDEWMAAYDGEEHGSEMEDGALEFDDLEEEGEEGEEVDEGMEESEMDGAGMHIELKMLMDDFVEEEEDMNEESREREERDDWSKERTNVSSEATEVTEGTEGTEGTASGGVSTMEERVGGVDAIEGPSWVKVIRINQLDMVVIACLCRECNWFTAVETELSDHLKGHVHADYARLAAAAGGEGEGEGGEAAAPLFVPCPIPYCTRAISIKSIHAMLSHVSMHVYHALLQRKSLLLILDKEEMRGITRCGHKTRLEVIHNGDPIMCLWDDCENFFLDVREFFDHCFSHTDFIMQGEEPHCMWDGCGRKFKNKSALKAHLCFHMGMKTDACPFCGEFFCSYSKMIDHLERRMSEMRTGEGGGGGGTAAKMMCKLCRKVFPNEKTLRAHCQRHVTKVQCAECGVCFATKYDRNRHSLSVHSRSTSQLRCTAAGCEKVFSTNHSLVQHQKMHSSAELHCPHCPLKFRWAKQLNKHVHKTHAPQTPQYVCHVCSKQYDEGWSLSRHLKTKHQMLQPPPGFPRFQYKKCVDGLYRLQTCRPHAAIE